MINIYDSANKMAEDLKQTPEFKALETAIKNVEENETSRHLFEQMDEIQSKIMQAQQTGQALDDSTKESYQKLNDQVQKDEVIVKLLNAEQGVYKLIDDLQKTFTRPINDLYSDLRKK